MRNQGQVPVNQHACQCPWRCTAEASSTSGNQGSRDPGDQFGAWTAAVRRERLCGHMAVSTTFNVRGKSIPDHVPFSFLPSLLIFFAQVLLCLPWSYACHCWVTAGMLVVSISFPNLLFTLSTAAETQRFLKPLKGWLNILHIHHHSYWWKSVEENGPSNSDGFASTTAFIFLGVVSQ